MFTVWVASLAAVLGAGPLHCLGLCRRLSALQHAQLAEDCRSSSPDLAAHARACLPAQAACAGLQQLPRLPRAAPAGCPRPVRPAAAVAAHPAAGPHKA